MAERPEHQAILRALATMDSAFLERAGCYFAGGTAISLRCSEFRVSHDVDFLCSSRDGYRLLRERVHDTGVRALFPAGVGVRRELRADRYGVRVVIEVEGAPIKLEIVSEGRIDLDGTRDPALPVLRLRDEDLVAEKLLANEDRFRDDATLGRDVVDLLMLEHTLGGLPKEAWDKAREAYGSSIDDAFQRAVRKLCDDPSWRERVFTQLSLSAEARAIIEARVRADAGIKGL